MAEDEGRVTPGHWAYTTSIGDMLCVHGSGAQPVPPEMTPGPPALALAVYSHRVRDAANYPNGMHEVRTLTDYVFLMDAEDAATLIAAVMAAVVRAGMMPAFRAALHAGGVPYVEPVPETIPDTGGYL
jgi:hypothetical protein